MTPSWKSSRPVGNRLLDALPRRELGRFLPHLKSIALKFEEILYQPDGSIRHVYFPTSSMISLLLVMQDGPVAEVGRVGNEGMVGLPVFLGMKSSHTRALVQIAGEALRMKTQVFREEVCRSGPLSDVLLRSAFDQSLWHTSSPSWRRRRWCCCAG